MLINTLKIRAYNPELIFKDLKGSDSDFHYGIGNT